MDGINIPAVNQLVESQIGRMVHAADAVRGIVFDETASLEETCRQDQVDQNESKDIQDNLQVMQEQVGSEPTNKHSSFEPLPGDGTKERTRYLSSINRFGNGGIDILEMKQVEARPVGQMAGKEGAVREIVSDAEETKKCPTVPNTSHNSSISRIIQSSTKKNKSSQQWMCQTHQKITTIIENIEQGKNSRWSCSTSGQKVMILRNIRDFLGTINNQEIDLSNDKKQQILNLIGGICALKRHSWNFLQAYPHSYGEFCNSLSIEEYGALSPTKFTKHELDNLALRRESVQNWVEICSKPSQKMRF